MFSIQKLDHSSIKEKITFDNLIQNSIGGTIFHEIKFLKYHKKKFSFEHFFIKKGEENIGSFTIVAKFEDNTNSIIINSPMGATYGGFVFKSKLNYSDSYKIIELILNKFKSENTLRIEIVFPIDECYIKYSNAYLKLAMINLGFKINYIEASSILDLNSFEKNYSNRVKRSIKKAEKNKIEVQFNSCINNFFNVYDLTYLRHGQNPTHNKEDLVYLSKTYPDRISFNLAYFKGDVVSGVCVFNLNSSVDLLFYICSDSRYNYTQANTFLIHQTIRNSQKNRKKYLDFGTCTERLSVKNNILKFKESFGCNLSFREKLIYKYE